MNQKNFPLPLSFGKTSSFLEAKRSWGEPPQVGAASPRPRCIAFTIRKKFAQKFPHFPRPDPTLPTLPFLIYKYEMHLIRKGKGLIEKLDLKNPGLGGNFY